MEDVDSTVEEVRRLFKQKQSTAKTSVQSVFREADVHGEGSLGMVEIGEAMDRLGMKRNDVVADRLLQKYAHHGRMGLKDFTDWFDDSAGQMILATPPGGMPEKLRVRGDNRKAKFLFIPSDKGKGFIGRLNEVLEAEQIESGNKPPRLDSNFSSVQYDILCFSSRPKQIDERLKIPMKSRAHLYDHPPPSGRRVAYHHGDTPYDIVTVRTPRSKESTNFSSRIEAPVRICTFSRFHQGNAPTLLGQQLDVTQGIVL